MSDDFHADVHHYDGLTWWGPLSDARIASVLSLIPLGPSSRALDVGCGRGELLLRLVRGGGAAVGVERSSGALAQAEAARRARAPDARVDWVQQDVDDAPLPEGPFSLVCWVGGPYIGGSFDSTVAALRERVGPGGYLLIGHGFWSRSPPAAYLAATGIPAEAFTDSWSNVEAVQAHGFRLLYSTISDRDEWDAFEGRIQYNVEQRAMDHPEDPDPQGRLAQRRGWAEAQHRWGRETMGFALYLFRSCLGEMSR